jgi:hypothetical protein
MSAIEPVRLARLGETVDEVVVVEWLVEVGAVVHIGDPLLRVETRQCRSRRRGTLRRDRRRTARHRRRRRRHRRHNLPD